MRITDEKACDVLVRNMVLKKVKLEKNRSNEIHSSVFIQLLTFFDIS